MGLFSRNKNKREEIKKEEIKKDEVKTEDFSVESFPKDEQVVLRDREDKLAYVQDCCDEILEGSARMAEAKKEYKAVNDYLEDIRRIKEAEKEKKEEIIYYAKRIVNLKMDRESYQKSGTKIPESKYRYIQENEKKMPQILKDLTDNEKYMQALKTDLHNIEGEKVGLLYERKDFQKRIMQIRSLAFLLMAIVAVVLGGMFYFQLNSDYDFTIGILSCVVVISVFVAAIVVYYQKNVKELRLNEKKMNKAIGLLNKYRLLYVNVKNTVDYTYRKLNIKNSYELGNYWRLYVTAKKEQQAYSKMSDELYEAKRKYTELIRSLELHDTEVWEYQLDEIIEAKAMKELEDNLTKRKKGLRKTMDFNRKHIDKYKREVKDLISDDASLAPDILKIVESNDPSF